ncbi:efflux transporter outer membrane subunit [Pseudoalteromonas sp. GB56]
MRALTLAICSILSLSACTSSHINTELVQPAFPANWQHNPQFPEQSTLVSTGWINQLTDPQIHQLVANALANNQALKQQFYALLQSEQQLNVSEATDWPSIDLSTQTSRKKDNRPVSYGNASDISLTMRYEVDLFAKLDAAQKQAFYTYQSALNSYAQSRQQLVADVISAWFNVIADQQLVDVYQQRIKAAQDNLAIIERGYRQGLYEALDVYLTRNEFASEQSALAAQQATLTSSKRQLERLVGEYPAGLIATKSELPLLQEPVGVGLPSELVTRKPQLQAAWQQLLAKDAALAFAHKQRYPSLSLTASLGDSTSRWDDLLSPSALAWSLLGNLSMPLFAGGELKANEEIARLALKETEQAYLETLLDAFADVENALTQEQSLKLQYEQTKKALDSANYAYELSFEQYVGGLQTYTTVLDAQQRAYNAQSALINIKLQLIKNRINLHLALGGDFESQTNEK